MRRFLLIPAFWIMATILLTACLAMPITQVDESLVGTWQGEAEIALPIVFDPSELDDTVERTRTTIDIALTIHEDGTVDGSVGEATITGSVLKSNRGELGRSLNVASDYLVADGYLNGPIVADEDETAEKSFTIPFDVVDGHLQGSIMWTQELKYPFPLCPLDLQRASSS